MRLPATLAVFGALALTTAACGEKDEPQPVPPEPQAGAPATTTTLEEPPSGGGGGGGGDGADGGGRLSPEETIEANVVDVIGGDDARLACSELVTTRYVRRAYGDASGCRAAVSSRRSFDVDVSRVRIRGDTATALARPAGGPNRGEAIAVELVSEGRAWMVDSALSNAPAGP